MPVYEYECRKCSLRFEMKRRFHEESHAVCPRCHAEARRIFTPVPIFFKGSGFYVTDNPGSRGNGYERRRNGGAPTIREKDETPGDEKRQKEATK